MSIVIGWLAWTRFLKPWHIIGLCLAAWTGIVGVKAYNAGGAAVIEDSKKEGKKNEIKSAKAHEKAKAPGAADRLRSTSCRDC